MKAAIVLSILLNVVLIFTVQADVIEVEYKRFYSHTKKLDSEDTQSLQFAFGFVNVRQPGTLCAIRTANIITPKKTLSLEVSPEGRFTVPTEKALKLAPKGSHYAFEPIPDLFDELVSTHGEIATIKNVALSDKRGDSKFIYVKTNPAYSGIKKRAYPKKESTQEIDVKLDTMDHQLKNAERINLIKIDVEGGEMGVLKGAVKTLKKWSPVVVFEHGLGASDYYGTTPEEMWEFLNDNDYCIFSLRGFVANKTSLTIEQFINLFETNKEYYFIAKAKV